MTDLLTTIDHDTIRSWAERRGGRPARARGADDGDHWGILRIAFDGDDRSRLQPISREVFFEVFDESKLALAYAPGGDSRVFKFVRRASAAPATSSR